MCAPSVVSCVTRHRAERYFFRRVPSRRAFLSDAAPCSSNTLYGTRSTTKSASGSTWTTTSFELLQARASGRISGGGCSLLTLVDIIGTSPTLSVSNKLKQ